MYVNKSIATYIVKKNDIYVFEKKIDKNGKNTTSIVQITVLRKHMKTMVGYRRNSTHFLRNKQPGTIPPTTIAIT